MYIISKEFTIDSAHRLYYQGREKQSKLIFGKCANKPCHGHTYRIRVILQAAVLQNSMVRNFNDIKKVFLEEIDKKYDHQLLNNIKPFDKILPTAENMAKVFYDIMKKHFPETRAVKVYETPTSVGAYYESD